MLKCGIKYAEARKLSCDGRKNLGMNRFEPWTPELEAECTRLFNEKCAPDKEKVETRSPPIDLSISKDTSCEEDSTESTEDLSDDENGDEELCVRVQESCSVAAIPRTVKEKVEPRSPTIDPSMSEGTSCDEDLAESTENLSDFESEDEESCVQEHESYSVATMPSTVSVRRKEKKKKSLTRKPTIHSFLGNLFGDRLNDCELIVDNAKMAPDRAIDFDALVRKRIIREEKYRRRKGGGRRGGRRPSRIPIRTDNRPTDDRFLATPPVPSVRPPSRMLLQDFQTTLDTCEKKGSHGAPKAPQRCESADDDDAFWLDVKLLQKAVKAVKESTPAP
jgi:hypothetical protein